MLEEPIIKQQHAIPDEPTAGERAWLEKQQRMEYAMLREAKALRSSSHLSLPRKGLILCSAALIGWLINHAFFAPAHHVRHATETYQKNQNNTVRKPSPNPNTVSGSKEESYYVTLHKPTADDDSHVPDKVSHIINPGDWQYVRSALVAANGLAQAQPVGWSNPRSGDSGAVILTDPVEDSDGCRQFRVTSLIQSSAVSYNGVAHVDFCRDGTIK
jgi:hypothetical protein